MRNLTVDEARANTITSLGFDPSSISISSTEVIAGVLRRSAAFNCPCSTQMLIQIASDALLKLVEEPDNVRELVSNVLESMTAYGDLLELRKTDQEGKSDYLVYLAPLTFIRRESSVVLLGVTPDDVSPLPTDIESRVEHVKHVRMVRTQNVNDLAEVLVQMGYIELSHSAWLKEPRKESAPEHLARLNSLLDQAPRSVDVPGLVLLNPNRGSTYWKGRWEPLDLQTGRFVGRRSQLYGSDSWCYIETEGGCPRRFLDFPTLDSRWRGCDEAWQLQAAIDAVIGKPQVIEINEDGDMKRIDFFSPVPAWARRRWDIVGEFQPPARPSKILFSYYLPNNEFDEELRYIKDRLWLVEIA